MEIIYCLNYRNDHFAALCNFSLFDYVAVMLSVGFLFLLMPYFLYLLHLGTNISC